MQPRIRKLNKLLQRCETAVKKEITIIIFFTFCSFKNIYWDRMYMEI